MKIRRINLYGSSGCGKSTTSSMIFYELKKMQYNIELITEYIKLWTYIPRKPISWDGYYVQAKQITREDIILRGGIDLVVSDSPLLMQYFYAWYHKDPCAKSMLQACKDFEKQYSSINIFIQRPKDIPYNNKGRYETAEESEKISKIMKSFLLKNKISFKTFYANEEKEIMEYVVGKLK